MSGLIPKVLAGGLSAGIFLLWWPAHVTATGSEWLFVRGILWSLAFEILLLAYSPVEKAVMGAVRAREPRRLGTPRVARLLTFAAVAVAVPLVMLAGSRPPAAAPARAAAPKVIVKREIVKREVVVRRVSRVVRVPGPTVTTTAPTAPATTTPARYGARRPPPRSTRHEGADRREDDDRRDRHPGRHEGRRRRAGHDVAGARRGDHRRAADDDREDARGRHAAPADSKATTAGGG